MKTNEMTKTQIVAAIGYKGHEAKKAMRRTKENLLSEYETVNNIVDYTVDNNTTTQEDTVMKNIDGFAIIAQAQRAQDSNVIVAAAPKTVEPKKVEYVKLHSTAKEICMKKYGMQREMLGKEEYKAFSNFINSEVCKKANYGITVLYKTLMSITNKGKWALVTVQKKGSKAQYNCLFWYEKKEENGKIVQKLGDQIKYVTK